MEKNYKHGMIKYYLYFSILILFISCKDIQEDKKTIPLKYYNVDFIEILRYDTVYNLFTVSNSYYSELISGHSLYKSIYSQYKEHHIFKNDDLEIVYGKMFNDKPNLFINILIGAHYGYSCNKCYYIFWNELINKPVGVFKKWSINEYTDTIYTNIDKNFIKKLYPRFKGEVINGNITSIVVDHNYDVKKYEFFNAIQLNGFTRLKDYYKEMKNKYKYIQKDK